MKKPPRLLQKIDPNVVMRPIRWPEEIVTGGVSHAPFSHIQPYTGYPGIPSEDGVKVVSWNVNGLDRLMKKNVNLLPQLIMREQPQILLLQETKLKEPHGLAALLLEHYEPHYSFSTLRKSYGGVACFVKRDLPVDAVIPGLPSAAEFSSEGRLLTVVTPKVIIVNVFSPSVGKSLTRLESRVGTWEPALRAYLQRLRHILGNRPICLAGDLQVAHQPIDIANPSSMAGRSNFTQEERVAFDALLGQGFLDTFRKFNPGRGDWFTSWSSQQAARERNVGARTDYILATRELSTKLVHSSILNAYHGSDHCPIACTFLHKDI